MGFGIFRDKKEFGTWQEDFKKPKGDRTIMKNKKSYSKAIEELVITRIESQLPGELKLFVGNGKSFTKDEIIYHIRCGDEFGKSIVDAQMDFLKAVSEGTFMKAMLEV